MHEISLKDAGRCWEEGGHLLPMQASSDYFIPTELQHGARWNRWKRQWNDGGGGYRDGGVESAVFHNNATNPTNPSEHSSIAPLAWPTIGIMLIVLLLWSLWLCISTYRRLKEKARRRAMAIGCGHALTMTTATECEMLVTVTMQQDGHATTAAVRSRQESCIQPHSSAAASAQ